MENNTVKTSKDMLEKIGQDLQNERNRQGLSCAEISARLRIPQHYIESIEAGEADRLPAMTYVIGYVRSYGNLLGLDAATLCAELKQSLSSQENKPNFDFVEQRMDQKAKSGRTALAALIAGIMIYGGWYALSTGMIFSADDPTKIEEIAAVDLTEDPVLAPSPETNEPAEGEAVEPVFTEVAPRAPQVAPGQLAQDNAVDDNFAAEPLAAEPLASETLVSETGVQETGVETQAPIQPVETPVVVQPITTAETAANDDAEPSAAPLTPGVTDAVATNRVPEKEITLKATANSWVEVTRADGSAVSQRLMRAGETYVVPGGDDLFLTTGNAGGLEVILGDADPVLLGGWGEALRELPLDQTIISQRY